MTKSPAAVRPRLRFAPAGRRNDAADVADLAGAYGLPLDEWQTDVLRAGLGVRADGGWAANTVCCNAARQNGKTRIALARALAGVLLFNERTVVVSSHLQKTARELFTELAGVFEANPDLKRRVKAVASGLGREQIALRSGARIIFPSRSRQSLRGYSVDCHIADEAQFITDEMWDASLPAMSARKDATSWLFGTVPSGISDGQVWKRLRAAAIAGGDDSLAWVEFGAPDGADVDDEDVWVAANPGRVLLSMMRIERRELSPLGFSRERLNIWPTNQVEQVVDGAVWASLFAGGPDAGVAPSALAVDADRDRQFTIAAAWLNGEHVHVELVATARMDPYEAVGWLTERAGKRIPILVDQFSAAAVLVTELAQARCKVRMVATRDLANAVGGFCNDVAAGRLTHAGQDFLTEAISEARRRPVGSGGAFVWDRRDAVAVPLVAATLARWGALTGRPAFPGRRGAVAVL